MFNNTTIKPLGTCQLKLINPKNDAKFKAELIVVKDKTFTQSLGNKNSPSYALNDNTLCKHLEFDEHAQPVEHPPRKVPVTIKDQLQTELNRLCDMNIITPVTKPMPLVSNLVTMEKRNQLRVCVDP